jgi:hypothetical protein
MKMDRACASEGQRLSRRGRPSACFSATRLEAAMEATAGCLIIVYEV